MATTGGTKRWFETFWTMVKRRSRETPLDSRLLKPTGKSYYRFRTGAPQSGFYVSMAVHRRDGDAECQLVIQNADPMYAFKRLKAKRAEIEAVLGPVDWEETPNAHRCLITQHHGKASFDFETDREAAANWLLRRATKFDAVFSPHIRSL
jgi:hypothetical protein